MCDDKNQHESANPDHRAFYRRVDDIVLHERLDLVEMRMLVHLRVLPTQHVDLRCGNAGRFQLLFEDLQVIEAVAYKIMP
jgi:hypothetical protein